MGFSWTSPLSPRPYWLNDLPVRLHKVKQIPLDGSLRSKLTALNGPLYVMSESFIQKCIHDRPTKLIYTTFRDELREPCHGSTDLCIRYDTNYQSGLHLGPYQTSSDLM